MSVRFSSIGEYIFTILSNPTLTAYIAILGVTAALLFYAAHILNNEDSVLGVYALLTLLIVILFIVSFFLLLTV